MKKLVAILLFLAVSAGLTWLVWFRPVKAPEEEKKPEALVPVHVGKVARMTLRSYIVAYGTVEADPKASAHIAVGVPGVVTLVKCVEGQKVERGELLFELDGRALAVAVNFAEKSLARQRKLAETDGTSQKLVQEAEQQLAAAQAQLGLLQVHAPIAGIITKVNIKTGEAADLTTVLAELVDFDHLVVSAGVSSGELAALKSGQPAEVLMPDSTNTVVATLGFVGPNVDAKTGSGLVRAAVPANSGLRLGQFVKVRVTSGEHKDILAVPLASLAKDNTGAWFIAMVDGEKAVLKPVKPGFRDGDWVEVEGDGVEADKPVVTEGAYGLVMTQQFATKIQVAAE